MYTSQLFTGCYKYAKLLNVNKIYILSAKYGLIKDTKKIEPYEKTLNNMSSRDRMTWSLKVVKQLKKKQNLKQDKFVILAGVNYREKLMPYIKNYTIPMFGLKIGQQLSYLKKELENHG